MNADGNGETCGFDVLTFIRSRPVPMPLNFLEERTGLTRHSVIAAKHHLHRLGIVTNFTTDSLAARAHKASFLAPNWAFKIETKTSPMFYGKSPLMPIKVGGFWGKNHPINS